MPLEEDLLNRALIVVAKEPQAGRTKTRLSPPLSGEQAAELYRCFLLDTLELMLCVEDRPADPGLHARRSRDLF